MASAKRLIRSFFRLFLPVFVFVIIAVISAAVWLVHEAANPPKAAYLVTPDKYGRLSTRGSQVTDETWTNRDNTSARGWLLRGAEGAPAVILLHRYGTDRSWTLDLGVKINEATNFTILMPDQRGHGDTPHVKKSEFGGCETEDVLAAIDFLKSLKNDSKTNPLVGKDLGIFGIELGAYAGLSAAAKDDNIKALVLDSVPASSDDLLAAVNGKRYPFASTVTSKIASLGTYLYFFNGCYNHHSLCDTAKSVTNRKFLLLAGNDAPIYLDSTKAIQKCLPESNMIESKFDLTPSGYNISNASLEQAGAYDQRVIDFFRRVLGGEVTPVQTAQQ